MDDQNYEIAFNVILNAGDARDKFMSANKKAREGAYDEASQLIEEGNASLLKAHKVQSELMQKEAQGEHTDMGILFTHAQDHLTMAILTRDLVEEMIEMMKQLRKEKEA